MVLEQKKRRWPFAPDEGVARRAQKRPAWESKRSDLFTAAALAPCSRDRRSEWVEKRKRRCCSNCELKPGWAQGFYDWRRVAVTPAGTPAFVRDPRCPAGSECRGDGALARVSVAVLNEMRQCGYTPWSAVHAVRRREDNLLEIRCSECGGAFGILRFSHGTGARRQRRDWLVREAVIQLCWALYCIRCAGERAAPRGGRRPIVVSASYSGITAPKVYRTIPGRSGARRRSRREARRRRRAGNPRRRERKNSGRLGQVHRVALRGVSDSRRRDPRKRRPSAAGDFAVMYAVDHLPGARRSPTLSAGSDGLGGDRRPARIDRVHRVKREVFLSRACYRLFKSVALRSPNPAYAGDASELGRVEAHTEGPCPPPRGTVEIGVRARRYFIAPLDNLVLVGAIGPGEELTPAPEASCLAGGGSCRGGGADRLLCGALKLVGAARRWDGEAGGDLSCGYSVRDYRDRDVVRALLIVFEGLLDARTVLRAAQLYVPELTAQLPYLRRWEDARQRRGRDRGSRRVAGGAERRGVVLWRRAAGRRAARRRGGVAPRAAQQRERSPVQGGLQTRGRTPTQSRRPRIRPVVRLPADRGRGRRDPYELMKRAGARA
ncbi:hypothetical protein Q5P01_000977 [Channa striata]|uniref:Uncharacterized protein n=1 Tax=Channa striata TaxID=64152 RepID=A0AA88IK87_CHASR|nr:hypothetical protein Q5P01_000977 [Channa striata]